VNDVFEDQNGECLEWLEKTGVVFLRSLGFVAGQRVLDFGCGYGGYSVPLAKVVAPDGRVFAVDNSSERLARLQQFLAGTPEAGVVEVHETAGELSFDWIASHSLDAVLLFDVLQHVADWDTLFSEVRRVISPGGFLYINPSSLSHPGKVDLDRLYRVAGSAGFDFQRKITGRIMHYKRMAEDEVHIFQLRG